MPHNPLLAPVAALVAWTLVMMLWMYPTRTPPLRRAGLTLTGRVAPRGTYLDGVVEDSVQWKSHNYNHLMEQPTLFYAVALSLVIIGDRDPGTLAFAWAYVGLRIAHSLVQSTVNIVKYRFLLFALASVALILLTLRFGSLVIRG